MFKITAGACALVLFAATAAAQALDAPTQADVDLYSKGFKDRFDELRKGSMKFRPSTPEETAAGRRVNAYLHRNVVRGPEWIGVAGVTGAEVMLLRTGETKGDMLSTAVRIEAPVAQPAAGYAWRSGIIPLDVDCAKREARPNGFIAFEGQNLDGAEHDEPRATAAVTRYLPDDLSRTLCGLAKALEKDQPVAAVEGEPPLPTETEALNAWIAAKIKTGPEWDEPVLVISQPRHPNTQLVFFRKEKRGQRGGLLQVGYRVEFLEPINTSAGIARSQRRGLSLDCATKTAEWTGGDVNYARRNLAGPPLGAPSDNKSSQPFADDAVLAPHFEAICAKTK